MLVVHANWTDRHLALWAEVCEPRAVAAGAGEHPGAASSAELRAALQRAIGLSAGESAVDGGLTVRLPTHDGRPMPSPSVAHATGHVAHLDDEGMPIAMAIAPWKTPCLLLDARVAPVVLERLEEANIRAHEEMSLDESEGEDPSRSEPRVILGDSGLYFAAAARFARSLLAEQRFVPSLVHSATNVRAMNGTGSSLGAVAGQWQAWLADEATEERFEALVAAAPPSARAVDDAFHHEAPAIVEDFLHHVIDRWCRTALASQTMEEAIEGWDAESDPQVAWLAGLLGGGSELPVEEVRRVALARGVRRWLAGLEDRGSSGSWRLMLRLDEPLALGELQDLQAPGDDVVWTMSFHLQSVENEEVIVDAEDIWAMRGDVATVGGRRLEEPQELLLRELGRASRVYGALERAMADPTPVGMELTTRQAYEFLREVRPLLSEQGFGVHAPEWWDSPSARIGARLQLDAPTIEEMAASNTGPASTGPASLGLQALVGYHWKIAIGDTPLTLEEFEKLAAQRAPLVRIDGRWVEVRPEDVRAAVQFIRETPGGEMKVIEALRLAYRSDVDKTGVPILGIDATGWVAAVLEGTGDAERMPTLAPPAGFHGELRPYQSRGLSWMAFLDSLGLGPCLADDMGLGKTIQLLALLLHERERAASNPDGPGVGPTLLVVPMSIVGNWVREAHRFAPSLRVLVHHGLERKTGHDFAEEVRRSDLVVTTYSLAHRDRESLGLAPWWRVVLDEAQNIKNPTAKQSQAIRSLEAPRRIVLTGTPLENRLSELWSIMDFCNPGFLGTMGEFRRQFSLAIERYHDRERSRQLRSLVRPFILRRLKTDPTVISDLPEKVETKEYCRLTTEQAALYEACVKELLAEVDQAEGIKRRGLVLTTLTRLKQVCNHPAQLPGGMDGDAGRTPQSGRSGKCIRLMELLEEVIASGAQALVFTQFRQMGQILATMLRHNLDREVLLLHGGTPQAQRQAMVDMFQKGDGSAPILVLSLKAGGVGLNLTAASHVFHFDRWWNPAVENQATDRAFRIGQTKTVNVHKFIVGGTLEDRIDQMIESKIALAEDVIGSGEDWLTELSTAQLRDILALRPEAVVDD